MGFQDNEGLTSYDSFLYRLHRSLRGQYTVASLRTKICQIPGIFFMLYFKEITLLQC